MLAFIEGTVPNNCGGSQVFPLSVDRTIPCSIAKSVSPTATSLRWGGNPFTRQAFVGVISSQDSPRSVERNIHQPRSSPCDTLPVSNTLSLADAITYNFSSATATERIYPTDTGNSIRCQFSSLKR